MQTLGNLADTEQDFTREAMSNDNVKHIGGLIKANAYLLNALRETASLSEYYLAGGLDGEIERMMIKPNLPYQLIFVYDDGDQFIAGEYGNA